MPLGDRCVELLVDQRVKQTVEDQVLSDEKLEPILGHHQVLGHAAHALPRGMRKPSLLRPQ